jgi:hypothetical protein
MQVILGPISSVGEVGIVTVSHSPQPEETTEEKLHALQKYARDFRRQHTTCYVSMARSARRELGLACG